MQQAQLRQLVQDTIAETQQDGLTVPIQLNNCTDLNGFVQQVLRWSEQPKVKQDIEQGRIRFALSSSTSATPTKSAELEATSNKPADPLRLTQGVITEAKVRQHGYPELRTLQVSPKVVITPSAKDYLAKLNIKIARLKS